MAARARPELAADGVDFVEETNSLLSNAFLYTGDDGMAQTDPDASWNINQFVSGITFQSSPIERSRLSQSQVPLQGMKEPVEAWMAADPPLSPDELAVTVMVPAPVAWTIANAIPWYALRVFPRKLS